MTKTPEEIIEELKQIIMDPSTYVVHVVAWLNGNKVQTAKLLGLCLKTVYNHIHKFERERGCCYDEVFVPGDVSEPVIVRLSPISRPCTEAHNAQPTA